jgi:quinol monooxygenase YgiN
MGSAGSWCRSSCGDRPSARCRSIWRRSMIAWNARFESSGSLPSLALAVSSFDGEQAPQFVGTVAQVVSRVQPPGWMVLSHGDSHALASRSSTRGSRATMSITSVTRFHSISGQEGALLALQSEGRKRMIGADGCEAFDILQDQSDPQSFVFIQTWTSREAHDAAFGALILASGHLEKVLAVLDEDVTQTFYEKVS